MTEAMVRTCGGGMSTPYQLPVFKVSMHLDLSSNCTSPRTNWRSAVVRPQIPWRIATGKSLAAQKTCPPNRWRPSPATRPTWCAPFPRMTINTAPLATRVIATPVALDSFQARSIRPW